MKVKGTTLFAHDKIANDWLPLMPADKIETSIGIENQSFKYLEKLFALLSLSLVKKQNRIPLSIDDLQSPPSGYGLVGVTMGGNLKIGKQIIETTLKIDNVLNQSYRDYLDRMRYFADAPGRNISLKLKTRF